MTGDGQQIRVGIDLVCIARFQRLLDDHPTVVDELFTAAERAYCDGKRRRTEHLAARFAAKEAVLKAFGTGMAGGSAWTDVEIVKDPAGRPSVRLDGAVAGRARRRGVTTVDVSLSHVTEFAMAQAIVVSQPDRAT